MKPHRRIRDRYAEALRKRRESLAPGPLTVVEFIDANRHRILGMSALEIGLETGTSDATVIRAVQALGFRGLREVKDLLEAWLGQTDSPVEKMAATAGEIGTNSEAAISFVVESLQTTLAALQSEENHAGITAAVDLLATAESVGLFGIGASGQVAQYGARLFTRTGLPARAYHATGGTLAEQLLEMRRGEVLILMAQARAHREALAAVAEARRLNVPIIMILGSGSSPLLAEASAQIILPRAKAEGVALHAPSLIAIETLHLAVAARIAPRAVETLDRLLILRNEIRPAYR